MVGLGAIALILGLGVGVALIAAVILYSGPSIGITDNEANNPFGPGEGPPIITMIHDGEEYNGQLLGYTYSNQQTISELPDLNLANITEVPGQIVDVTKGSSIAFEIEGNPSPEARFDSLEVTAYTNEGKPVTLLDAIDEPPRNNYTIDSLDAGEYILLSTATWLPEEGGEAISGYTIYGHRIQVVQGSTGS
jgi:hypothetical protein